MGRLSKQSVSMLIIVFIGVIVLCLCFWTTGSKYAWHCAAIACAVSWFLLLVSYLVVIGKQQGAQQITPEVWRIRRRLIITFFSSSTLLALLWEYLYDLPRRRHAITILTTPTKDIWLRKVADLFNARYLGRYYVTVLPALESRQGMQAIRRALRGINADPPDPHNPNDPPDGIFPVIFCPSSSIWLAGLIQHPYEAKFATTVLETQPCTTEHTHECFTPLSCRRFFTSDLVVLSKPQTLLSDHTSINSQELIELMKSHSWDVADPTIANSGALLMLMILQHMANQLPHSGQPMTLRDVARHSEFENLLKEIKTSTANKMKFLNSKQGRQGSMPLFKAYIDYQIHCDFIVTYESNTNTLPRNANWQILKIVDGENVDHPFAVLSGISQVQRQGANEFLEFIDAVREGLYVKQNPSAGERIPLEREAVVQQLIDCPLNIVSKNEAGQAIEARADDYDGMNDAIFFWSQTALR